MQSHRRAHCSLHHRAESAGDLVVTEPAPDVSSPVLGQLMFALEVLVPMGIPGSHKLRDHRKEIADLSAMKKLRGGGFLFPLLSSSVSARALSEVPEVPPQVHTCCWQGGRQRARRVCGIWGQIGV